MLGRLRRATNCSKESEENLQTLWSTWKYPSDWFWCQGTSDTCMYAVQADLVENILTFCCCANVRLRIRQPTWHLVLCTIPLYGLSVCINSWDSVLAVYLGNNAKLESIERSLCECSFTHIYASSGEPLSSTSANAWCWCTSMAATVASRWRRRGTKNQPCFLYMYAYSIVYWFFSVCNCVRLEIWGAAFPPWNKLGDYFSHVTKLLSHFVGPKLSGVSWAVFKSYFLVLRLFQLYWETKQRTLINYLLQHRKSKRDVVRWWGGEVVRWWDGEIEPLFPWDMRWDGSWTRQKRNNKSIVLLKLSHNDLSQMTKLLSHFLFCPGLGRASWPIIKGYFLLALTVRTSITCQTHSFILKIEFCRETEQLIQDEAPCHFMVLLYFCALHNPCCLCCCRWEVSN